MRWHAQLAGLCIALGFAAGATATPYHSEAAGYTIDLPAGWARIPDADVQQMIGLLMKPGANQRMQVDAAFGPSGQPAFTYPYLLVQIIPYPQSRPPTDSQMREVVAQFTGATLDKVKDQFSPDAQKLTAGAQLGQPTFDPKTHSYEGTVKLNVPGIGPVRSLLSGRFGSQRLIQLNGSMSEVSMARDEPILRQVANSFRFDAGAEYKTEMPGWLNGAIIGGIAGGLIGALSWVFKKKKATATGA